MIFFFFLFFDWVWDSWYVQGVTKGKAHAYYTEVITSW